MLDLSYGRPPSIHATTVDPWPWHPWPWPWVCCWLVACRDRDIIRLRSVQFRHNVSSASSTAVIGDTCQETGVEFKVFNADCPQILPYLLYRPCYQSYKNKIITRTSLLRKCFDKIKENICTYIRRNLVNCKSCKEVWFWPFSLKSCSMLSLSFSAPCELN